MRNATTGATRIATVIVSTMRCAFAVIAKGTARRTAAASSHQGIGLGRRDTPVDFPSGDIPPLWPTEVAAHLSLEDLGLLSECHPDMDAHLL
jgi:hypothetical protein